jgi:uncharacterized protein (TIGR00369 family)
LGETMLWDAASPEEEESYKRIIESRVKHSPFYQLMDMEVVRLSPGKATLRLKAGPQHCDETGKVHPGVVFGLADASCGVAMATLVPYGAKRIVTVEMKVNFLAPAGEGELSGTGEILAADGDIAVCEAEVLNELGDPVARSVATFMIVSS